MFLLTPSTLASASLLDAHLPPPHRTHQVGLASDSVLRLYVGRVFLFITKLF